MPVLAKEVIADAPPAFMEKVHKLRAIRPGDITCRQAKPYYHDMAKCNLEAPAPTEIYRHVKNCASCKEQVIQLRRELGVAIPQVGSVEFENLLTGKSIPQLKLVSERRWPPWVGRMGVSLRKNWRKMTVAAAVAVFIVGFLIFSPSRAAAVTFEQVCQAFARVKVIYIDAPREKSWYSKEPLVQITIRNDGTYSRFTASDGQFVRYCIRILSRTRPTFFFASYSK
ncbi:MAG: hypothetical protein GWP14_10595 [Actinobacteria bacterium]|nr:hypothetical protein [Actinomycetota bacterium]